MKNTTIYKQLLFNILIPVVVAFLILAYINYRHTKNLMLEFYKEKNYVIYDEIKHLIELQDIALEMLESNLRNEMRGHSERLVKEYFKNADDIESADLYKIREEIGMNVKLEDLYIINTNGIVINTTYKKDLFLNFFQFGEEHKQYLLDILKNGEFVSERFGIESTTKRLRKYSYQPTLDGKYIIEIGKYSQRADDVVNLIINYLSNISAKHSNIKSVDLIIGKDAPFSVNRQLKLKESHIDEIKKIFHNKSNTIINEVEDGKEMQYDYIYMDRKNTDLYKDAVIQIVTDKNYEKLFLRNELLKNIVFFGITILLVMVLVYIKTQSITSPIEALVDKIDIISDGDFNQRADVKGSYEISKLSRHFNQMLERVKQRTVEIQLQKEEITSQAEQLSVINKELEKLSVVASETDNGISIYDKNGKIEWINAGFEKIYGYSFSEISYNIGANIRDFSKNPDIDLLVNICLKTKQAIDFETEAEAKTGKRIWVQTTLTPILDTANEVQKLIAIDSNISFQKQIEEKLRQKNKDITDSIAYAKRIQDAILPKLEVIRDSFPDSFVFYKPKGIVSGDFYWFNKQMNKILFAAVDCTGHGIPGALISVLGITFLNEIVNKSVVGSGGRLLYNSSDILFILREYIIKAFQQTGKQDETKDGMDISLCIFDTETYKLQFSGAYNSLFYISDGEMQHIKGDKMPISIHAGSKDSFTNHDIQVAPGDVIYISTDGFADQFGGVVGKKFLTKQFKKLLHEIHEQPFSEQYKSLNTTMQNWKGDLEQVDDILVMGFKIPERKALVKQRKRFFWKGKKILLADVHHQTYEKIRKSLAPTHVELIWSENQDSTLEILNQEGKFNAILVDSKHSRVNKQEFFAKLKKEGKDMPIIILAEYGFDKNKEMGEMEFIHYLTKPIKKDELLSKLNSVFSE